MNQTMKLRFQSFLTGLLALLMTLALGLPSVQAKPALGGYQEFLGNGSGVEAPIQLASLGNLSSSPETASEYANAPNRGAIGGKKLRDVSAADANAGFGKPPYDASKPIVDFRADGTTQYVRVYNTGPTSSQGGQWMMKSSDIKGLSPQQIKDKFDLPEVPTHITDVKPPINTRIRTGTVNSGNFGGNGGGTQFQLKSRIPDDAFTNPRPLQ